VRCPSGRVLSSLLELTRRPLLTPSLLRPSRTHLQCIAAQPAPARWVEASPGVSLYFLILGNFRASACLSIGRRVLRSLRVHTALPLPTSNRPVPGGSDRSGCVYFHRIPSLTPPWSTLGVVLSSLDLDTRAVNSAYDATVGRIAEKRDCHVMALDTGCTSGRSVTGRPATDALAAYAVLAILRLPGL